jgi:hypothetical protein
MVSDSSDLGGGGLQGGYADCSRGPTRKLKLLVMR